MATFTGDPTKLVASPTLQDALIDKTTGLPLAAGIITCYQDSSRSTFKRWYTQSGTFGAYTYSDLNNPLTLSAVGTIQDNSGNDVIPYFYPWDETNSNSVQPYYITVVNSLSVNQFTRSNFPLVINTSQTTTATQNLIVNKQFWRNIGGTTNTTSVTQLALAPGAHEGFVLNNNAGSNTGYSGPDIQFFKNNTTATDSITFNTFTYGSAEFTGDIRPQYYATYACTSPGSGETYKAIQIPVSLHLDTLSELQATFTIQAMTNSVSANNTISIYQYQYLGAGVTGFSPTTSIQQIGSPVTLTTSWTQYQFQFNFQSATGISPATGGDDALFILIGLPMNKTCNVSIALPSLYLGNSIPTNDFQTYDQVNAVIDTPRTGDIRTSMNSYVFGYVAMNDGTIGNASSNSTTRANIDTWPLYSLLWAATVNTACPSFTSAGVFSSRGATAIADFNNNVQLAVPKQLGRVLAGANPSSVGVTKFMNSVTSSGGFILLAIDDTSPFYTGTQVTFSSTVTLPGNIFAATQYYLSVVDGTTLKLTTSLANLLNEAPTYIGFSSPGSGTISFTTTVSAHTLASFRGEDTHGLMPSELAFHTHGVQSPATHYGMLQSGGNLSNIDTGTSGGKSTITGTQSNNGFSYTPTTHNNIQPSTYYNIFIKL